jgi:geranylgeranyl diphosphate synthase type II
MKNNLDQYREQVNACLDELLQIPNETYARVYEAMRYSVMNAGKRIRPVLAMEFCRLNGGNVQDALPYACAVEMIHCYSLIHDDLPCMDDDDLRRGKPSCHKQFDEATALLAGDGLLTKAFEVMSSSALAQAQPARAVSAIRTLSGYAGADGMIGGQMIDLSSEGKQIEAAVLHQMHLLKTSALISAACKIGAICAGAGEKDLLCAQTYGENLGLAFQIVDDILDVVGTEAELGKKIGSDAENQKVTYVTLYGMEQAQQMAQEYTDRALQAISEYPEAEELKAMTLKLLSRRK